LINAITLLLGSIFIIYKSITRIINPQMPEVYWMLGISVLGILFNGVAVWKLKSGKSMNKQVMTIHLLEDALGWVAVLIGSVVLLFYKIPIIDPILAIVINVTVLVFVLAKMVKAIKIMMQRVPPDVNLPELRQKILCVDNVKDITHLHVWSLTKEKAVVSVRVNATGLNSLDEIELLKNQIREILSYLKTEHVTIEVANS
jgi:cobalt-zinc-cadmium efflux system protein